MQSRSLEILIASAICAATALGLSVRAFAAGVIQVKAVIEIDGAKNEITLGDIMELRGINEASARELKAVRLADAPLHGEVRSFTDVGLQQLIRTHLRATEADGGSGVVLRIPSRVTVSRRSLQLRSSEIGGELRRQFKTLCSDCEFEISGLSIPAIGERIPVTSTWSIKIRPELPRGGFSVPLEIVHEDGTRRIFWIGGTLAVRKRVPVASRALAIGERVSPEDFMLQLKDVTFATDSAAGDAELTTSLVGRQVAAGQIIWKSNLRREAAVRMGDPVRVVLGSEAWEITVEGVAQGSGYIGDRVRVKIPRTQKIVSGLLNEKGRVDVQ